MAAREIRVEVQGDGTGQHRRRVRLARSRKPAARGHSLRNLRFRAASAHRWWRDLSERGHRRHRMPGPPLRLPGGGDSEGHDVRSRPPMDAIRQAIRVMRDEMGAEEIVLVACVSGEPWQPSSRGGVPSTGWSCSPPSPGAAPICANWKCRRGSSTSRRTGPPFRSSRGCCRWGLQAEIPADRGPGGRRSPHGRPACRTPHPSPRTRSVRSRLPLRGRGGRGRSRPTARPVRPGLRCHARPARRGDPRADRRLRDRGRPAARGSPSGAEEEADAPGRSRLDRGSGAVRAGAVRHPMPPPVRSPGNARRAVRQHGRERPFRPRSPDHAPRSHLGARRGDVPAHGSAGAGDSASRPDGDLPFYRHDAVGDVRAAVDELVRSGAGPIIAAGTCNGAYLAFHALCEDPRIAARSS